MQQKLELELRHSGAVCLQGLAAGQCLSWPKPSPWLGWSEVPGCLCPLSFPGLLTLGCPDIQTH